MCLTNNLLLSTSSQEETQMAFFHGSCLGGVDSDFRVLEAYIHMRSLKPENAKQDVSVSVLVGVEKKGMQA